MTVIPNSVSLSYLFPDILFFFKKNLKILKTTLFTHIKYVKTITVLYMINCTNIVNTVQINKSYKSKLLERLVLETIQSKLTVKDSMEYVIKYFHRTGTLDFKLSQSYYEKLRKSVKEKIETGNVKLDEKPTDLSNDDEKINEVIDIYFFKIQHESIRPERTSENFMDNILQTRDWNVINETTNMLIKLIQLKNKIKN